MKSQYLNVVQGLIESNTEFCIAGHTRPDGDALGSALSLASVLYDKGKKVNIFFPTPRPEEFSFLPFFDRIFSDSGIVPDTKGPLFILDASDLSFCGLTPSCYEGREVIVIDHHATNTEFGTLNFVDTTLSSTCELVFSLLQECGYMITPPVATSLLTGILTDTQFLSNQAVQPSTLNAVAALVTLGAHQGSIMEHLSHKKSVASFKLLGLALYRLKLDHASGVASTYVSYTDISLLNASENDSEGISNFLASLNDARMVIVWKEMKEGEVRASLRTRGHLIDVSKIATLFGGGGHQKAAGFTIRGRVVETDQRWSVI